LRLSKAPKMQKSKVFLAFLENYTYLCPKKTKRNGTMEKELKELLEKVEAVRRPLCERASILRQNIMGGSTAEWIKGETQRCKRELAMSRDCTSLRDIRDAINTILDNRHLLDELLSAGTPENFFKIYDHE